MESASEVYTAQRFVIEPAIASFFVESGLLTTPKDKKRRLSASLLSSSPSENTTNSSDSSVIEDIGLSSPIEAVRAADIEIPEILESEETFEYIGLAKEVASYLWAAWKNRDLDSAASFLDHAIFYVENRALIHNADATADEDLLKSIGANTSLRQAILLTEFTDIRGTASCVYWLFKRNADAI